MHFRGVRLFGQVDAEWMTRFHAGMAVPASLDTDKPQDVFSIHGRNESGEGGTDLRCVIMAQQPLFLHVLSVLQSGVTGDVIPNVCVPGDRESSEDVLSAFPPYIPNNQA